LKASFLTSQVDALLAPNLNSVCTFCHARYFDPGVSTREQTSHCEMNPKISSSISVFAGLLLASLAAAYAQSGAPPNTNLAAARTTKPVGYTTAPKLALARLKSGESNLYEVRGRATLTVTAANNNDTVTGTLIYALPDEARQKIAQLTGQPLNAILSGLTRQDVVAAFQPDTACPVVRLKIGALELDVAGAKLQFNRIVLDVVETADEVPQHFCAWTRQINAKRQRRGIIASLNRLLTGEQ
jgi:hypothetical protein